MEQVITVNKPIGLTPLQAVTQFRKKFPLYASEKIGYAGRLDPMAEGLLLLLVGDNNKTKEQYEQLDKEYL
jgi:tRNA pseudouridine55 synthase